MTATTALPCHPGYLKVLTPALGEGRSKQGPQNGKASAFQGGITMNEIAERPRCECGVYLEIRKPHGGHTPEQKFCGVWYDHPASHESSSAGHTRTVLYPSEALLKQLGESE